MPDLGLEIEDFQAQTWRIENWSQQPKRLVGPEFSCGGHKWCVPSALISGVEESSDHAGGSCCSRKEMRMASLMTWFPFTSITPTRRLHPKAGTPVLSFVSPSPTLQTPQSTHPVVSHRKPLHSRIRLMDRCSSPLRRRRVRLGFHQIRRPKKTLHARHSSWQD